MRLKKFLTIAFNHNMRAKYKRIFNNKKPKNIKSDSKKVKIRNEFNKFKEVTGIKDVVLNIYPDNRLNASSNMVANNVNVTSYDLKELNINELKALIGHEMGHHYLWRMPQEKRYSNSHFLMNTFFILVGSSIVYMTISFIMHESIFVNNIVFMVISLIFSVALVIILENGHSKNNESYADKVGASLAGKNNMIELLRYLDNRNREQIKQDYEMVSELKLAPLSYIKCRFMLFLLKLHYYLLNKGYLIHPSCYSRIKYLKNSQPFEIKKLSNSNIKSVKTKTAKSLEDNSNFAVDFVFICIIFIQFLEKEFLSLDTINLVIFFIIIEIVFNPKINLLQNFVIYKEIVALRALPFSKAVERCHLIRKRFLKCIIILMLFLCVIIIAIDMVS